MAFKPIQILITAKDEASAVFTSLQAKALAVGAAIASYFGIQAFTGAVKGAADLEAAMSRVQYATGASAAEMALLRQAAEDAGLNSKFTATQAAEALENLAKAGLNSKDAIQTLPGVMHIATASGQGLAQTADQVVSAVMGMGLSFKDAARVTDVLTKGADSTKTSVGGLSQALSYAAPVANSLGISLESTVAMLGQFSQGGIDASRAGTALNSILSQFSNPASKFREELAAAGITTTNFDRALRELAASGPVGAKAINAVGQEAGPALRAMLNQGIGPLNTLTEALRNSEGAAAAAAKAVSENLNGSMSRLANVWDSAKNILLTPVLPVIKDGVDALVDSLRGAIADGSLARFGESLRTAFQGAIEWVKQFAASFNWDELMAKAQAFATDIGQRFDQIGQTATTAGNIVQTAWGLMWAGANTVLGVVERVGSGFALLISRVNDGVAWIAEKLSSITFGDVSKRFAEMAADMRTEAGAFMAVSDALANKADEAFIRVADAAQSARDGYSALSQSAANSASVIGSAMAGAAAKVAEVGGAALEAAKQVVNAGQQQAIAINLAKEKVEQLRAAYRDAIDAGNLQEAAELMLELNKATLATTGSAQELGRVQKEAAEATSAAFQRAGVKTKDELSRMATLAKADFETIKQSGQATAEGLAEAWRRAAEAAIRANNGIVPGWVQAQASVHKFKVAVDEAGKATMGAAEASAKSTQRMADGWSNTAAATANAQAQAEKYAAFQKRMQDLYGRAGDTPTIGKIERTNTVVQGSKDLMNQWIVKRFGEAFIDDQRAQDVFGKQAILEEWRRLGVTKDYDGSLNAMYAELRRLSEQLDAERSAGGKSSASGSADAPKPAPAPAPSGSAGASGGISSGQYVINVTFGGVTYPIRSNDPTTPQTVQDLLAAIDRDRKTAAVH